MVFIRPMVIKSAVKIVDRKDSLVYVVTDKRHADIYERLHEEKVDLNNFEVTEGFLTDDHRFVDRYEAKRIAVAAKQLIVPEEDTYPALFSEDVW